MSEVGALNRDSAKEQPASIFESPLDIITEIMLTKGEKLATLERWRLSILDELSASNEGMATPSSSSKQFAVLEMIEAAKASVKKDPHLQDFAIENQ